MDDFIAGQMHSNKCLQESRPFDLLKFHCHEYCRSGEDGYNPAQDT